MDGITSDKKQEWNCPSRHRKQMKNAEINNAEFSWRIEYVRQISFEVII